MEYKKTLHTKELGGALLNNDEYFKYIFKKTEKIVCTVFYVMRGLPYEIKKDTLVESTEEKALCLLNIAEKTLLEREGVETERLRALRVALVSLESALALLRAVRLIEGEVFQVFQNEIGVVHRTLASYVPHAYLHDLFTMIERDQGAPRSERSGIKLSTPKSTRVQGEEGQGEGGTRADRIKAIIKEKGQVTIKDISLLFSDVSEKTIQRELMSLISQGQITKTGERRWSKYKIV